MEEFPQKPFQPVSDEFWKTVGYAISVWAEVDHALFLIFRACVGPTEQCAIIYYRTPGLDLRLSLTDEIVRSVLPKREKISGGHDHEDVVFWKKAIEGFRPLLAIRRRVAHHPVIGQYVPPSRDKPEQYYGHKLEFFVWPHEELRSGELPRLSVEDLRKHITNVSNLKDRLYRVLSGPLKELHSKHVQQDAVLLDQRSKRGV